MKFHEWETTYEASRRSALSKNPGDRSRLLGVHEFYERGLAEHRRLRQFNENDFQWKEVLLTTECNWWTFSRPYYKAYPSITKTLIKLNLDMSFSHIPRPVLPIMVVRFAVGSEQECEGKKIASILFSYLPAFKGGFAFSFSYQMLNDPTVSVTKLPVSDKSVDTELNNCVLQGEKEIQRLVAKIAITVCLLSNDPSIITPEVLAADREKYDATKDPKYIDKAKRRGIVGWNIGADYEVCPHYRRPHFGIRFTGKGGTGPKIVPIKGAVVHRSKLTDVPTGYILPDGREVEPPRSESGSNVCGVCGQVIPNGERNHKCHTTT